MTTTLFSCCLRRHNLINFTFGDDKSRCVLHQIFYLSKNLLTSISLSLSLARTHTHTHTDAYSPSLCVSLPLSFSISLYLYLSLSLSFFLSLVFPPSLSLSLLKQTDKHTYFPFFIFAHMCPFSFHCCPFKQSPFKSDFSLRGGSACMFEYVCVCVY